MATLPVKVCLTERFGCRDKTERFLLSTQNRKQNCRTEGEIRRYGSFLRIKQSKRMDDERADEEKGSFLSDLEFRLSH